MAAEHTKHGMELTAQGSARLSSRSSISSSARTASSGEHFHPFIITSWPKRRSLKSLEVVYSMRSSAAEPRRSCSSTRASAFHSHDVSSSLWQPPLAASAALRAYGSIQVRGCEPCNGSRAAPCGRCVGRAPVLSNAAPPRPTPHQLSAGTEHPRDTQARAAWPAGHDGT